MVLEGTGRPLRLVQRPIPVPSAPEVPTPRSRSGSGYARRSPLFPSSGPTKRWPRCGQEPWPARRWSRSREPPHY